jgi:hypothetical protein
MHLAVGAVVVRGMIVRGMGIVVMMVVGATADCAHG